MLAARRRKPVKIAVIGDEKVGKTSLVVAASNESFPDACPPVVPAALLPADCTPEGVPLQLVDTSSRAEERTALEQACLSADVIVLLFDLSQPSSLKRIGSYWMPELRRLGLHIPVVLVGSKLDISKHRDVATVARPITQRFREIESCLECSARRLTGVVDAFYYALKAVAYPVAPLFDPHVDEGLGALRPLCVRALKRVFLMNDRDKDGALNDAELNSFQVNCFSAPLQPEELIGIRRVVSEEMPQGVNAIGLTLPGFLFLHALFIERGRLETVWAVLRKYGYNDALTLSHEVLGEVTFARSPDQVIEMTEACRNFFGQKFMEFDKDGDKLLSVGEQADMFSVAPAAPWRSEEFRDVLVETGTGRDAASLTLPGFLAKWAFTTARDPVRTLAYVRYLGFDGPAGPLFNVTRSRRQERRTEQLQRSVVQAHVFLGSAAGAGLLGRHLAGKSLPQPEGETEAADSAAQTSAAGEVAAAGVNAGGSCTLLVSELPAAAAEGLARDSDALAAADVAAFQFAGDDAASFRAARDALLRLAAASGDALPCVLVSVEGKGGMSQDVLNDCSAVCSELELRQPLSLSVACEGDAPAVLQALLAAAASPDKALAIPQTPSLKAAKRYQRTLRLAGLYVAGGVAGGLLCYAAYRAYGSRRASSDARQGGSAG